MTVKRIKHSEFIELYTTHWPSIMDVEFICPRCNTVQTGNDLVQTGAGANLEDVDHLMGYTCIGRLTKTKGCHLELGGILACHKLEIIDDNNMFRYRPCFEINLPKDKIEEIVHA